MISMRIMYYLLAIYEKGNANECPGHWLIIHLKKVFMGKEKKRN